jgi:H(+)-translocating pyrophosphatase
LKIEYLYISVWCLCFGILLAFTVDQIDEKTNTDLIYATSFPYTCVAFLVGAATSLAAGYIGMTIAVMANVRVTQQCTHSVDAGFKAAFLGGEVLGFMLVGLALFILVSLILIFKSFFFVATDDQTINTTMCALMMDMVAGYGLGGSTVALFGRVGGGIYTKAADVGSDLAGKVLFGMNEDDPRNPGVMADNVGDNVGDIAGMGADLFGSLAESTCAALVIGASSESMITTPDAIYFPLIVTASGILVSWVTQYAILFSTVTIDTIEKQLKIQLGVSTVLMTVTQFFTIQFLPDTFTLNSGTASEVDVTQMGCFYCVISGLWAGLIIGLITEYYTSNTYEPVKRLTDACQMGEATNIIRGLALGYLSTVIPIFALAITIYISFTCADMYGVALAALGMLGCLPIALAIDGYGPIADNAGGIAEMSHLEEGIREKTDKLDAAGNTTAAIGKGFAIGSACLVALALFGAFITRIGASTVNILEPITFAGLLIGAMIPYWFSAMTMDAVGETSMEMVAEISSQLKDPKILSNEVKPDYKRCIEISTKSSLKFMIAPGMLVLGTPFFFGLLFSTDCLAGVLAGCIVSGIQIAFSFSNTGGAWDNCKKYIEAGEPKRKLHFKEGVEGEKFVKKINGVATPEHCAAVIGDTVGDPLKDTSGPSINILIKLSAITSLVFGQFIFNSSLMKSAS